MNDQSTLVGLFKETYAKSIVEAWGFMAKLGNRIPFVEKELQPGNYYHQPLDLTLENGISQAAAGVTIGTGTSVFFPATAGQMQDAQITGTQLIGRALVSYEAIARSANSKAAFKEATEHIVNRLSQAVVKRLELQLLHGGRGIGTIASLAAETGSSGAYFSVITLDNETWGAGIWAALEGAFIDVYQSDLATVRQAANINTGVITGTSGWCRVSAVDTVNKTVTLNYGTARSGWVAGDVLCFAGGPATEMKGLDAITQVNAASGTFWNIATGSYNLHRANQYPNAGTVSFGKLLEAAGLPFPYGLTDDLVCVIPGKAFDILNTDLAALRQYDVSYTESRATAGAKTLKFFNQNGSLEIMPHPFQKDGKFQMFPVSEARRVGATDVSFIKRHGSSEKLILESATSAGSEMRCYSNQALFVKLLRHTVGGSGLTY